MFIFEQSFLKINWKNTTMSPKSLDNPRSCLLASNLPPGPRTPAASQPAKRRLFRRQSQSIKASGRYMCDRVLFAAEGREPDGAARIARDKNLSQSNVPPHSAFPLQWVPRRRTKRQDRRRGRRMRSSTAIPIRAVKRRNTKRLRSFSVISSFVMNEQFARSGAREVLSSFMRKIVCRQ